ncbi:MaoC/PaaZ C-terminal domain-containing protein [Corynebacterium camporealensis]|uniref:MaoC/PaaZ C-terminal domain-containing protein n=1 Tax=Corynebacterium camporealensis TaxID=161896 RepID=UPI0034CDCD82
MTTFTELDAIPELGQLYRAQALKAVSPGGKPDKVDDPVHGFRVTGLRVDPNHLAAYTTATGLRLANELPVSYLFVLAFPLAIKVMDAPGFPFPAMGAVHLSNSIRQHRPALIDEEFTLETHAENLRPHRKGLVIDMISRLRVGEEVVWEQVSSFLSVGASFSKGTPVSVRTRGEDSCRITGSPAEDPGTAVAQLRFAPADVQEYAQASGDKNPIHVSKVGAKAFGFPNTIAHGMYSLARILAFAEGRIPASCRIDADFYKPVILPAKAAIYAADGLELRSAKKPEKLHVRVTVAD